eukprot:5850722-Amphidinium_carterae.1
MSLAENSGLSSIGEMAKTKALQQETVLQRDANDESPIERDLCRRGMKGMDAPTIVTPKLMECQKTSSSDSRDEKSPYEN